MQGNQCCVFLFVARLAYIGFALVQSGMQVLCIVQQTTNGLFVTTGPFECRKIMSAPLKALYNRTQQTASAAVSLPSITESVAFVCIVMVTEQACACSASVVYGMDLHQLHHCTQCEHQACKGGLEQHYPCSGSYSSALKRTAALSKRGSSACAATYNVLQQAPAPQ